MSLTKVFIRSPYNYDLAAASDAHGEFNDEPSATVQSMRDDADLNVLMARFGVTGKMPENVRVPSYGDFTDIHDFGSAMQAVREAQVEFDSMPADIRFRFANDPQRFLEFCENPANGEELVKLGLATRRVQVDNAVVAPPVAPPVVPPVPAAPKV